MSSALAIVAAARYSGPSRLEHHDVGGEQRDLRELGDDQRPAERELGAEFAGPA